MCVGLLSVHLFQDITTAKGEEQCDEDDYGYESNMSQQIFSKLANQYASMPEDEKLKFVRSNKKGTIDDIKVSIVLSPKLRGRHKQLVPIDVINAGVVQCV